MQQQKYQLNFNTIWPFILLVLIFATYAYQLIFMGFYWDDWQPILLSNIDAPDVFWNYYLADRPFSIWTYLITFPILENIPERWLLFTLVIRWLGALGFWLILRGLWPNRQKEIAWMTALWAVFPGFYQQMISVAYSQHFITYMIFNFSLVTMIWAYKKPRWFYPLMATSWIFTVVNMFTMEYFIGLEAVRLVILWILNRKENEKFSVSLLRTAKKIIPYLFIYAGFFYYRLFWLKELLGREPTNELVLVDQLSRTPFEALVQLAEYIMRDLIYLNFFAWLEPIRPEDILIKAKSYWFAFFAGLLIAVLIAWLINKKTRIGSAFDRFYREAFLIAASGMVFGGIPVWAMGELVTEGRWSDRFALAPMFGVIIFFVALVVYIINSTKRQSIVFVFILGIAIAYQMRIVNDYRKNWVVQRDFYWQMAWRIPGVEPQSTFLSPTMPFGTVAEYSISYALNTIFSPTLDSNDMYTFYFSALRYADSLFGGFQEEFPFSYGIRSLRYESNTSNSLVFYWVGDSCYWITNQDDVHLPNLGLEDQSVISISHPEVITSQIIQNKETMNEIFGPEFERSWCYYYQKGELAAQFGNWSEVIRLREDARQQGLLPEHGRERLPFITAAAMLDDWDYVYRESVDAMDQTPDMNQRICILWQRIEANTQNGPQKNQILDQLRQDYECSLYN